MEQVARDTAKQIFPKLRMAVGTRNDQVAAEGAGLGLQRISDRSHWDIFKLDRLD